MVGAVWWLFVLSAPIGPLLIVYGAYLWMRFRDFGEEYVRSRRELKWEFNQRVDHREGSSGETTDGSGFRTESV